MAGRSINVAFAIGEGALLRERRDQTDRQSIRPDSARQEFRAGDPTLTSIGLYGLREEIRD